MTTDTLSVFKKQAITMGHTDTKEYLEASSLLYAVFRSHVGGAYRY